MPKTLHLLGFEARNVTDDGLVVLAGLPSYSTTDLPPGSLSGASLSGSLLNIRAPWLATPSTDAVIVHGFLKAGSNLAGGNSNFRFGMAESGIEFVSISYENATNKFTLRVAGTVVATSAVAHSVGTWVRVHIDVAGVVVGDHIKVYVDGNTASPAIDYTIDLAAQTALTGLVPDEFIFVQRNSGFDRFDDLMAWDPADAAWEGLSFHLSNSIKPLVFTGNGSDQDWDGDYTDIDEIPGNSADFILATAVGSVSNFTKPAIGLPNVFAAKIAVSTQLTGSAAGENLIIRVTDGTDSEDQTVTVPGDGRTAVIFDIGPDGLPWTETSFDAATIAFESET